MPKPFREQEESRASRRKQRGHIEPASWLSADAELLRQTIVAVTAEGGAVRFGYTKQGGAFAIGFLGDGEPYTDYVRPTDDIDQYLKDTILAWSDDDQPKK